MKKPDYQKELDTLIEQIKIEQKTPRLFLHSCCAPCSSHCLTYLAEFSSDLCKDAGAGALASQVELFGKLSILVLCMPIMTSLLETIEYFLGG